jgi:hypothetical protein
VRLDNPSKGPFQSETGILTQVRIDDLDDCKIMLRMKDDQNHQYAAVLMFDDAEFCLRVYDALKHYVGKPIKELDEIEIE